MILCCISLSSAMSKDNTYSIDPEVVDLKFGDATNPIGTDVQFPQLSWRIESKKGGYYRQSVKF